MHTWVWESAASRNPAYALKASTIQFSNFFPRSILKIVILWPVLRQLVKPEELLPTIFEQNFANAFSVVFFFALDKN